MIETCLVGDHRNRLDTVAPRVLWQGTPAAASLVRWAAHQVTPCCDANTRPISSTRVSYFGGRRLQLQQRASIHSRSLSRHQWGTSRR